MRAVTAKKSLSHQLVLGTVTLERLAEITIPAMLRPQVRALARAHGAFAAAAARVTSTRSVRAVSRDAVKEAARGVAPTVHALAGAVVAAGLGELRAPFAAYGASRVSAILKGARPRVVERVASLAADVLASSPPPEIAKAARACASAVRAVSDALGALGKKRARYDEAREVRDAAAARSAAAFEDMRNVALVALRDQPEVLDRLFKPVEPDRLPTKRKPKAKKEAPPAASDPARTGEPAVPTSPTPTPSPSPTTSPSSPAE